MKKLTDYIKNTWLCIKYPFLYPRNRFTGLHYTVWSLNKLENDLYVKNHFGLSVNTSEKPSYDSTLVLVPNNVVMMNNNMILIGYGGNNTISIIHHPKAFISRTEYWDLNQFIADAELYITDIKVYKSLNKDGELQNIRIVPSFNKELSEEELNEFNCHFMYRTVLFNHHKHFFRKLVHWFHHYPVQWIFCIPSHTELDAMDTGWRKAFGLQMCKEIKQALLNINKKDIDKDTSGLSKCWDYIIAWYKGIKALYSYRIMQIKEKWGQLCWYDAWGTSETFKIIAKYENLSYNTCIVCGKPAKYISRGWISPYCEDCIKHENIDHAIADEKVAEDDEELSEDENQNS